VYHLKNRELGNVAVLTATFTTAASTVTGILMNLLSLNSETLRILAKFCNQKPSKYRNLVKICNELVKEVKKYGLPDRTQGGQI